MSVRAVLFPVAGPSRVVVIEADDGLASFFGRARPEPFCGVEFARAPALRGVHLFCADVVSGGECPPNPYFDGEDVHGPVLAVRLGRGSQLADLSERAVAALLERLPKNSERP